MGKPVHVAFDGGRMTSDAGILLLAAIEQRLGIAGRLADCIEDPRAPERVRHGLAEMIRYRALLIAAGYPDGNDCDALKSDPAFKMAVGRLPESGADLCSQPTFHMARAASALPDFRIGGGGAVGASSRNSTNWGDGFPHNPYLRSTRMSSSWVHPPAWQQNSVLSSLSLTENPVSYPQGGQPPTNSSPDGVRPSLSAITAAFVKTRPFRHFRIGCPAIPRP